MKDHINNKIKHREPFRPFAPIVMEEEVEEYFDIKINSPYMLFACNVKEVAKEKIPAIVHYDWTARLQTVNGKQNPSMYKLLKEFKELSGVGVLLNTSLNDGGDPLVESPEDAICCFSKTGLDYLVMHDYLVYKNDDEIIL